MTSKDFIRNKPAFFHLTLNDYSNPNVYFRVPLEFLIYTKLIVASFAVLPLMMPNVPHS